MKRALLICFSVLAICGAGSAHAQSQGDQTFEALYQKEWAHRQGQDGITEDTVSEAVPAHLPDVSEKAQGAKLSYWLETQAQLHQIDPKGLSADNQINYQVYDYQLTTLINAQKFKEYQKPLNSDSTFWSGLTYITDQTFRTEQDYLNYLSWLGDVPTFFEQNIDNMRAGLSRGFTPPQVTLKGREVSLTSEAEQSDATKSHFYEPFLKMPDSISPARQNELRTQGASVISKKVRPAYQNLYSFFTKTYVPGAQKKLGAVNYPDGEAYYHSKVYEFTTLDMSADDIHQVGLNEVAKIHAEMLEVMKEVGFEGTFPEFLTFLRTDPQFYATTPEGLLYKAAWIAKRFDGVAAKYFKTLPRARFAIIPVPADIAPFYTAGRGGPGVYLVNTYNLPARPLYSLPALTLHESAPGHAFQMSLSAESNSLPAFRAQTYISAYGEGWALYCEKLGVEMGMYETPYERFGMLSYQMWRASRLVVDTGIHTKGWTREQAVQYMLDNTALSEHEINTEIDRYISWPGQALSYYMGELEILKLRKKAETELGAKFDIRDFHEAILSTGSVPLNVLDQKIDDYIGLAR